MMSYKRFDGETDGQLIYRICSNKDLIGTWEDVALILNELLDCNYTESAYRKKYQSFKNMYDSNQEVFGRVEDELEQIRTERRELEKEKIKFRDERNEYKKLIREEARKESYKDLIKRTLAESQIPDFEYIPHTVEDKGNDLIIHLTDIHCGININTWFNHYDDDVLYDRLQHYLDKVIEIAKRHKSQNAHIIIGEILSGLIHENLRCENNQNTIEQFLTVSAHLKHFLYSLSSHFDNLHVYVTPGNHSRVVAKKEASLKGENFDNLLIPFLSASLQNIRNIKFHENDIEESIAMFSVRGNKVFASHGDKDSESNVVQKFTLLFGITPDLVYLGHRHYNAMTTVYNTKIIQSGCVSGADNYALDLRLNTSPEQTVSVVDDSGLVCLYDIQL